MPQQNKRIISVIAAASAALFVRVSGLLTQVITALYLSQEDFGVYAIGLSIAAVTFVMRGGGTGVFLQSMQPREFKDLGGSMLRISIVFSVIGFLLTIGTALPVRIAYGQEQLGWILLNLAFSNLIAMVSAFPRAKQASDLRFVTIATVETAAAIVKLGVAFFCARSGWGPLTFAIAQLSSECLRIGLFIALARITSQDFAVPPNWIGVTAQLLPLPITIAIITSLGEQGDTFVASWFLPVASLGVYFFATQLTAQPFRLIAGAIQSVLAPHAAQTRSDRTPNDDSVSSAFLSGIVFMPLLVMAVPTCYPSASRLIWGDKWDATIWPVALACPLLLYPTVLTILEGPLIGLRKWREVLRLMTLRIGSRLIGSVIGVLVVASGRFPSDTAAIILVLSVGMVSSLVCAFALRKALATVGIDRDLIDYELWLTPLYSVLAAVAVNGVVSSIMPLTTSWGMSARATHSVELLMCIVLYSSISIILLRFSYFEKLCILIGNMPEPLRVLVMRMTFIPASDLPRPAGTST